MTVKPLCWILLFCFTSFSTSHYIHEYGGASPLNMWDLLSRDAWTYLLFLLALLAVIIYLNMLVVFTISLIATKRLFHKPSIPVDKLRDVTHGVSIIKPLMGVDPFLEHNLESHFKLTYRKFELLFCFHDDQDAAIPLVQKLHQRYPHVDAKYFFGGKTDIINPMVQNMAPAYDAASYEFVWICSSRVEVSDEIIFDMTSKLQKPEVSLVHQMPFTTDGPGFGSTVEKVYFGCALSKFYVCFNMLGLVCVTGMSYVFKKSLLDDANGLEWYGRFLAEDFFLTSALHERGQLVISSFPARQNVSQPSLSGFVDRMVRWIRLRFNMLTIATAILEPLCDCLPLGLWTAWAVHFLFGVNPVNFFVLHLISWMTLDYILLCIVQNGYPPFSKFKFVVAWIVRELSATYIYIVALSDPQLIRWGKRTFRVKYGGLVERVKEKDLDHL